MCASKRHDIKSWLSELSKCYHCGNNHRTVDQKCAVQHEHEEIIIKLKMQITIEQAKFIYGKQNPQYWKTCEEVIQANRSDVEVTEGYRAGCWTIGEKSQSNKEKVNEEKTSLAGDAVCISPASGSIYTKTV